MKSRLAILGLGVIIGLGLMLVAWQVFSRPYTYQGSLIDPPVPAADFTLTDQNGLPYRLSDQQGKVVLIFFGYTHCPDVCPATLSEFKQVKSALGSQAQDVEFVFITVDPERDTPETLKAHLAIFDPSFIGLTGTETELGPVWKDYGVYHEKKDTGSAAGYLVNHSAITYAIDKQGNWRLTYPFGMETQKLVDDVSHLVQGN
jgi:protein SCO1/2